MRQSTLNFNKEILVGECGALIMANVTAPLVARLTASATVISAAAVIGTLLGGGLGWLAARIYDQVKQKTFGAKTLASDIGYFTPAALVFGFTVYDPVIYVTSHQLLTHGSGVEHAVILGQLVAFSLFLLCLNVYRVALFMVRGKSL